MPVASGVVKRFDRVMISLCGLPLAPLMSRKPSPPAPPALLMTTMVWPIRLCLAMMPWTMRAIWSAQHMSLQQAFHSAPLYINVVDGGTAVADRANTLRQQKIEPRIR